MLGGGEGVGRYCERGRGGLALLAIYVLHGSRAGLGIGKEEIAYNNFL